MNSEDKINNNTSNYTSNNASRPDSTVKPTITITGNSDYKRPASTLSVRSQQSTENEEPLKRDWYGFTLLSFHIFISTLLVLSVMFAVIWEIACLFLKIIHTVEGIPQTVTLLMALVTFVALAVSSWLPVRLLLSGSATFRKLYAKEHQIHYWSSIGVVICGLICVSAHIYLVSSTSASRLTPFLPGGLFLVLTGLFNLKIYYETVGVGKDDQAILLPYVPDKLPDEDDELEMTSVSSRSGQESSSNSIGVGYDRPSYNNNV